MKIFTKSALFVLILSNAFLSVYSQSIEQRQKITSGYDLRKLKELQAQFSNEFFANYNKALEAARLNNWPLRFKNDNGAISELQGINEDGTPIYYIADNAGSAITSRANKLYPGGSLGLNLTGQGMFAGVWDSSHARADHLDLAGRVFVFDPADGTTAEHSTHVTGTIMSSGEHSGKNSPGKGIAYEASVWTSEWTDDLAEMTDAAAQGMLLSNHSYGLAAGSDGTGIPLFAYGAYISATKSMDDLIFSAPYYQPVVSAGNGRNDIQQLENPTKAGHDLLSKYGTAKNTIVVAAVFPVTNFTGPTFIKMSGFSNYGPTADNRIKPDISDKGVAVWSTTDVSTTSYASLQGTSMASPGVTGTLLLLQQHYSNVYSDLPVPYMKNATLRGLMCHTADEAGDYDGPDSRFGWGLINAEKAAQTITKSKVNQSMIAELTLNQGETYSKNINVTSGEPLMATIAWTDKSGKANNGVVDLTTPVLVNDLDIRITKNGGDVYFPWKLNDFTATPFESDIVDLPAVKGDNIVDNIEKVQVDSPSGDYTVTVTHKGVLSGGKQDFSLILTGSDLSLRVNENDFQVFDVWPNPAKEVLNISLQSDISNEAYVTLYDIEGKRIVNKKLDTTDGAFNARLDLNSLSQGMYLVKIDQGDKQAVKKIIIQK